MVIKGGLWVGFVGMVRSVWAIGEWAESHWIIGVTSFQKIYGSYVLKHLEVEISEDVTEVGRTTNQQGKIELLSF